MKRLIPGSALPGFTIDGNDPTFAAYEENRTQGYKNPLIGKRGENLFLENLIAYDSKFIILESNYDGEKYSSTDAIIKYGKRGIPVHVQIKTTEKSVRDHLGSNSFKYKFRTYNNREIGSKKNNTKLRYFNIDFFVFVTLDISKIWILPSNETPRNINIDAHSRSTKYYVREFDFHSLKVKSLMKNKED